MTNAITPDQVPPWCHLSGDRSPEEAAAEAMKAHKTTSAIDALVLLWNLRRVAAADAEFLASAETKSATSSQQHQTSCGLMEFSPNTSLTVSHIYTPHLADELPHASPVLSRGKTT
ncbi:MAG TPA: hypothetical protein VGK09_10700 [Rhodocyclaceae bacterium]